MFTAHMNNEKIAEELLAETHTPQEAYEYSVRREKCIEHSKTMKLNPIGTSPPTTIEQEPIGYIQPRGGCGGSAQPFQNNNRGRYSRGRQNQNTRGKQHRGSQNYTTEKHCYKCGNPFGSNHLQSCPARDKICTKSAKRGHFAKVCRSDQVKFLKNNEEDDPQNENENQHQENDDNDPVAYAEFTSRNGWEELQRENYSIMSISDAFEIKQTAKISEDDLNGHIVKAKSKSIKILANADSGSPMSFLNETTARQIQQNDKTAIFKTIPQEDKSRNLAFYKVKLIIPKGRLILAKKSDGWSLKSAPFIVVDDQKANILGRNLLPNIGINIIQEKPQHKQMLSTTEENTSNPEMKQWVKENFPYLCVRIGQAKKTCYENTIHTGSYTNSTKGSTYSDSSTRKSRKRTE